MTTSQPARRKRYVPAVGPRLKKILFVVFTCFALLGVNAAYLVTISLLEWRTGKTYENYFYQVMFLVHLVLGALILVPFLLFGAVHVKNTLSRKNRRAIRAGLALLTCALVLLVSGILLTRLEGVIELKNPVVRRTAYWAHVISPVLVVWLFILHRLAGRRIKWRVGGAWLAVSAGFALVMALLHSTDPRKWNVIGPESGEKYFFPSLARTADGNFIPSKTLMMDKYCVQCHPDIHDDWYHSAHHFSSFSNPAYLFSVRETRRVAYERDGDVQASRFCAGCHDPVPFFSGAFDDPNFDDVHDPTASAGITCTVCHAITNINSPRGNSDYTIDEPTHYPFAFSRNRFLRWVNRTLVRANPAFHKKTFLKPLHDTAEFCGTCHKVHLPEELNKYKWLRGQNHYDPYLLSGVSGHGAQSFYYPPKAVPNCQQCHMKLEASNDFGAAYRDDSGVLKVHDHLFPSANTAITQLMGLPDAGEVQKEHEAFEDGVMRVDLFGIRDGGTIDGQLHAPLRPELPALQPGKSYLVDAVIRTMKMGHVFTQGTADSNEVWMDVTARSGDRLIGRSGAMAQDGEVDRWAHFVNAYVLDRDGHRIDRRNAQDIFIPLYSHQIPPGAADVVEYRLDVPPDATDPIVIDVALRYRKFDTRYMRYFQGDDFHGNDLPIMTLATDRVVLPIAGGAAAPEQTCDIPDWQRWNDYGIGLLRKGDSGPNRGELRQAEDAFGQVERLGRPDGPLNLARVYLKEGRLDEATEALDRASKHDPPAYPWVVLWLTGQVNQQNGFLEEAADDYRRLIALDTTETRERGFDFSKDYRVLDELGTSLFELAVSEQEPRRSQILEESRKSFEATLVIDPEDLSAHYNLARIYEILGDKAEAAEHRVLHERYKPDDNARDRAVSIARENDPAADHAAESIVIYDLSGPQLRTVSAAPTGEQEGQR